MSQRGRVIGFGSAAVLVAAGVAGGIAFAGTFGQILALVLISLGLVLATALVFLEVGLSEDRERAREQEQARAREQEQARAREAGDVTQGGRLERGRRRSLLPRSRGQRRRLR